MLSDFDLREFDPALAAEMPWKLEHTAAAGTAVFRSTRSLGISGLHYAWLLTQREHGSASPTAPEWGLGPDWQRSRPSRADPSADMH